MSLTFSCILNMSGMLHKSGDALVDILTQTGSTTVAFYRRLVLSVACVLFTGKY